MGLYTTVRRPSGRTIAPYTGRVLTKPDNRWGGEYAIQLTPDVRGPPFKYVDANKTTDGAGRYANTARRRDHFTNNSRLLPNAANDMARVSSIRAIPAGREIFTQYGNSYFARGH